MVRFYLGTHRPYWLSSLPFPLFVSHRTLSRYKKLPRAIGPWSLDSGGFSELKLHGRWTTTPAEYLEAVARYREEVGNLDFASPQDWMCEPFMLAKTGLTVEEHQHRTIENYLILDQAMPGVFIPVLQGWELSDYLECIVMYWRQGVDLSTFPVVGIGSVCRRQATSEIAEVLSEVSSCGINLHGFGVKQGGIMSSAHCLVSADSMAWSYRARFRPPLPGHDARHKNCANCLPWAVMWRQKIIERLQEKGDDGWSFSRCTCQPS